MDFEQSTLNSQCEEDCSLIHEQFHDVVPIQIDLENDEIETVADEQLKDGADNCSSKLKPIDEDEVETVADEQLKDGVDNFSSKLKLIYEVKNVEEPKEGMLFGSIEELHEYYRSYAKQEGFGVVQKKKKKNKDENVHYISLGCARQGKRQSSSSNSFCKPSQTIRTGCKATLNAKLVDTKWYVTCVTIAHNHALSPGKARYFRSHKILDPCTKRKLEINDRAGIRMNKIYNSLAVEAGGYENLTFGEKDCRNYIAKARHLRLGTGGAAALYNYFCRMRKANDDFYFDIDMDDECRMKNVFWADARSRASYEVFGDVVTFDTTYLTNKYDMPFAPFVGVNHHGQSILFGAALISSEDTTTFVWLFEAWLKCMKGRAPMAIITDQDRAMKNAINKVFPNARHRFCLWHILKKLPEKFGSHSQYNAIKSAIRSCVYDSQTCDEFDASWQNLLKSYNLEDNAWLRDLYKERTFWVPAYLKSVFWAGMTTTQRSESINSFFDGYVHSSTSLKEFADQYDNALRKRVESENVADFNSFNSTIQCVSRFSFEKQFQELYTHNKFKEVQEEIRELMYCDCSLLKSECGICAYQVIERVQINSSYMKKLCFTVYYSEPSCEVNCSCCLFESRGILCRHVISVLSKLDDVLLLPEKYFLKRWRKDLKQPYKLIKSSYDPLSGNPSADRYAELCKYMCALAAIAAPNVDHYTELKNDIDVLTKKFSDLSCVPSPPFQLLPSASTTGSLAIDCTAVEIHSPHVARIKGKRVSNRTMSAVEKAVVKKAGGNKKKQSDTNPNQQVKKKKKKICQRSLVDELDTCEDLLACVTDVQHDQVIGTQNSIVTQSFMNSQTICSVEREVDAKEEEQQENEK